jgi:pimeloyl-ACP methyl ester carboxylesterase
MYEINTRVNGLKVRVFTAGKDGSPVVLLHGGGTDSATLSWRLAIRALAARHRVFAPDWPGYGASEVFPGLYTSEAMVAWLHALLDHLGLESVNLVGVSMGGGGALAYTLAHPERVSHLVPVDSYALARKAPMHLLSYLMVRMPWLIDWTWAWVRRDRRMAAWSLSTIFADKRNITPDLEEEVWQAIQNPTAQRSFAAFQRYELGFRGLRTCLMDRLGEIRCPTLIIQGEKDSLVPITAAREAAGRIPGARLAVIQGAGHWPMREKPQEFNQLLVDFFTAAGEESNHQSSQIMTGR